MKKQTLSVVLATLNEEENIGKCLDAVKDIADEIIVVDEHSSDDTVKIAEKKGAKVYTFRHENNFHETKQYAIEKAKSDWILQLDADEIVSKDLAKEIELVINGTYECIREWRTKDKNKWKLFMRYQKMIEEREGGIGKETGEIVAFFIPRINYFVGKPLIHAGVYPDAVIRLFKRGKARLPAKSVHELMEVDGELAWIGKDLEHHESPTLSRYLSRANRYTTITAKELARKKTPKTKKKLFYYSIVKPKMLFIMLYIRHRGYKDGMRGFLWSAFSAWHWPLAYWKYWVGDY